MNIDFIHINRIRKESQNTSIYFDLEESRVFTTFADGKTAETLNNLYSIMWQA